MGVPWNPEWEARIQRMADERARRMVEMLLSDGSTLGSITPGSIPSLASTAKVTQLVADTTALAIQTQLSGLTGAWAPLNPVIELTAESGGRPVLLLFAGSGLSASEEVRISLAVDGAEVTNTDYGLNIFQTSAWTPLSMVWLLQRPPARFRVAVVGRRDAAAGSAQIGTYVTRSTLTALEV